MLSIISAFWWSLLPFLLSSGNSRPWFCNSWFCKGNQGKSVCSKVWALITNIENTGLVEEISYIHKYQFKVGYIQPSWFYEEELVAPRIFIFIWITETFLRLKITKKLVKTKEIYFVLMKTVGQVQSVTLLWDIFGVHQGCPVISCVGNLLNLSVHPICLHPGFLTCL